MAWSSVGLWGTVLFAAPHNNHSRPFTSEVKKYLVQRSITPWHTRKPRPIKHLKQKGPPRRPLSRFRKGLADGDSPLLEVADRARMEGDRRGSGILAHGVEEGCGLVDLDQPRLLLEKDPADL